jgi:CO/xanthine dehydrogenase FAD-binding subunit
MIGRKIDAALIDAASEAVMGIVHAENSLRGRADYLREMVGVMTRRALQNCAHTAGCEV